MANKGTRRGEAGPGPTLCDDQGRAEVTCRGPALPVILEAGQVDQRALGATSVSAARSESGGSPSVT